MCETTMIFYNSWKWWKTLVTKEGWPPPPSSFPVDPDFCVTTSFQLLTLALSYCQSDISNPSTKISRHFIFNLKSTMTKNILSDLFKDSFLC
jgi:hypothetical protein